MPRRSAITLRDVVSLNTLVTAFCRASRGHGGAPAVQRFGASLDAELARLREDVLEGRAPDGRWTTFTVFDPKRRVIQAPCFRDRVLHHALMEHMGPVLERALVDDTYACRPGRGTLAAVRRAQAHVRRFAWCVKADVRAYFASIDHGVLRGILQRRFRDAGVLGLCARILTAVPRAEAVAVGLPIGALTSQHFANAYLDALDRHLLETLRVRAMVRYMDDVLWWCDTREEAAATLASARAFAQEHRKVVLKPDAVIARSTAGVSFLGFRVTAGALRLSLRRKRRYAAARARWERAWEEGRIDALALQAGGMSALAVTAHADAVPWRRAELARRKSVDA